MIVNSAGTNDALQKYKIRSVGSQMSSLIDLLFDQIPGTTVILSTLLPNKDQPTLVENINGQYRRLAAKRRADGDRLVLAEMSTFIKASELVDATHPDDAGYKQMASVWWAAIEVAFQENKIQNFNYTMTSVLEKSLDNSTSNPNLPSYTAPAQPTETSAASSQFSYPTMLALVMQLFVGKFLKSFSPRLFYEQTLILSSLLFSVIISKLPFPCILYKIPSCAYYIPPDRVQIKRLNLFPVSLSFLSLNDYSLSVPRRDTRLFWQL